LLFSDLDALTLDVQPNVGIEVHVDVRDPDERKPGDKVASPVGEQQLIARQYEKKYDYVVAEAVFASKQVEEFAFIKPVAHLAVLLAPIARLAKDIFMG